MGQRACPFPAKLSDKRVVSRRDPSYEDESATSRTRRPTAPCVGFRLSWIEGVRLRVQMKLSELFGSSRDPRPEVSFASSVIQVLANYRTTVYTVMVC